MEKICFGHNRGWYILAKSDNLQLRLDSYISDLLYTTDCVIIPGLGGFVANTRTAFLNPAQHTFSPPTKRVAFNSNLRTNDGLLAHHLSSELDISYVEALNQVQRFVDDAFAVLNEGGRLHIDKVGTLSFDLEQHLQFQPDNTVNYLSDSFGLGSIHSPAIRREESPKLRKLKGRSKTESGRSRWRLLELVPAAAVLALLAFNPKVIPNLNSGLSSLNPFAAGSSKNITVKEKPEENRATDYYPETAFSQNNNTDSLQQDTAVNQFAESSLEPLATTADAVENKVKKSTAIEPVKAAEPVSTKVENTKSLSTTDTSKKSYYVIGGCFSVYENAVRFRDEAIADGLNAVIIGENEKGLHMVSLFSSNSRKQARLEMTQIKEKFETGAWMFSK